MTAEDLDRVRQAHDGLRRSLGLPALTMVRLAVDPPGRIVMTEGATPLDGLDAFDAGWLAFRSGVTWFAPDRPLPDVTGLGPLLAADLAAGQESLHIRYDSLPEPGWLSTRFREGADDGTPFLAETVEQMAETGDPAMRLRYRRYWAPADDGDGDGSGPMTPRFARFLGFATAEA